MPDVESSDAWQRHDRLPHILQQHISIGALLEIENVSVSDYELDGQSPLATELFRGVAELLWNIDKPPAVKRSLHLQNGIIYLFGWPPFFKGQSDSRHCDTLPATLTLAVVELKLTL